VWKVQVRRKGSPTTEYQVQTFDQTVLAPAVRSRREEKRHLLIFRYQCFFDPRVFDWNAKMAKVTTRTISASYEDDTMPDLKDDGAVSILCRIAH
jgi:hypothetical protein